MTWDTTLPVPEPVLFPDPVENGPVAVADSRLDPEIAEYFFLRRPRVCPWDQLIDLTDAGFARWKREKKRERGM